MLQAEKCYTNEYIWDYFQAVISHQGKYLEIRLNFLCWNYKEASHLDAFPDFFNGFPDIV